VIEKLLDNQCSHEHLENLSGSKAGSKTTIKQLNEVTVNIAEDQKQPRYVNTSLLTRVISGEPISISQKGNENFEFVPYATMLFSVNEVIDFKETGIYITDRFVVIPFNNTFTDDKGNRNINIGDELCKTKALKIIATRAIHAFDKVLENGKFTIPESVQEETDNYFMDCNNVAKFCSLFPIKTLMMKKRYYKEYCNWCNDTNREAVSDNQFGIRILELGYGDKKYSFGNKRNTYYTAPDFQDEDSRIIYNEYLAFVSLTEEGDIAYDNDSKMYQANSMMMFEDYLCKYLYNRLDDVNGEYAKEFRNSYKYLY